MKNIFTVICLVGCLNGLAAESGSASPDNLKNQMVGAIITVQKTIKVESNAMTSSLNSAGERGLSSWVNLASKATNERQINVGTRYYIVDAVQNHECNNINGTFGVGGSVC